MKLTNPTEKLISVSVPIKVGKYNRLASKWEHVKPNEVVDIDDEMAWRGESHGLVPVGKNIKDNDKSKIPTPDTEFSILKGIDDELDGVLADKYGSLANMKEKANKADLVAISGIGNKRADSIIEQLKNL